VTSYEDLSLLNQLQKVHLTTSASASIHSKVEDVRVVVRNPSKNLAFQIHLSIVDGKSNEEILPVLWDDNYFSLMPGESRTVIAHYSPAVNAGQLRLEVDGWNIDTKTVLVGRTKSN
jgi:exo-1,4-beta-D-glucosaminidase